MKKISFVVILLMLSIVSFAQKEVTKFLGIPVDGTKQEMEQKLKNKGFVQINGLPGLCGEFNGKDVFVLIQTVKGKVWRLNIIDQRASTETLIKEHFNNLCEQFKNNPKYQYFPNHDKYIIPEGEDVGYEMGINHKEYQAVYSQFSTDCTTYGEEIAKELKKRGLNESNITEDDLLKIRQEAINGLINRTVWFEIQKNGGDYRIVIFYENGYNKANGEDL